MIEPLPQNRLSINLEAECAYVERLRQEWLAVRAATKLVRDAAVAEHKTPPNNYWEAERRAEKRFMMALHVLTVLEGESDARVAS